MRNYITILVFVMLGSQLLAQPNADRRAQMEERIQSMRIAFITEKLALTPQESQSFWPVYNEFIQALDELKQSNIMEEPDLNMTEAEAEAYLEEVSSRIASELALKKEYENRLREIIPVQKLAMLHFLENDFKKEMLNRVKNRRNKRSR